MPIQRKRKDNKLDLLSQVIIHMQLPSFDVDVYLFVCDDIQKMADSFLGRFSDLDNDGDNVDDLESDPHGLAILCRRTGGTPKIGIFIKENILSINVVAHEVSHVLGYLESIYEEPLSSELKARIFGYLMSECLCAIVKKYGTDFIAKSTGGESNG